MKYIELVIEEVSRQALQDPRTNTDQERALARTDHNLVCTTNMNRRRAREFLDRVIPDSELERVKAKIRESVNFHFTARLRHLQFLTSETLR